jgi:hypothetical protein
VRVRVQPRASRNEIVGWREDVLSVRVTAPPVNGRANAAVAALLAAALGVRPSAVTIVRGAKGREKVVSVAGLSRHAIQAHLGKLGGER